MLTTSHTTLSAIFNLWAKNYSENPEEWLEILDDNGQPVEDYGECCARYFKVLHTQLFPEDTEC